MKISTLFQKQALTLNEAKNIKGGLRYITDEKDEYKAKKNQLDAQGICYCTSVHLEEPGDDDLIYCIEW